MPYKETKGVFMWESRRNFSGGKGESSIFRSVEIKAQLIVADIQEEKNRGSGWVGTDSK